MWSISGQWIISASDVFNLWKEFFKKRSMSLTSPFPFSPGRHRCWSLRGQCGSAVEAMSGNGRGGRWGKPHSQIQEALFQPHVTHSWTALTWERNRLLFFLILLFPLLFWTFYYSELNFILTDRNDRIILTKILLRFQWKLH